MLRLATFEDLDAVKRVADKHRHELGFIVRKTFEDAIKENRLLVVTEDGEVVGFTHFRLRKDGVAIIYDIAVLPSHRGRGYGRQMVNRVLELARRDGCHCLMLRCPQDLPSNGFYRHIGFELAGVERGKIRPLNLWRIKIPQRSEKIQPLTGKWNFVMPLQHTLAIHTFWFKLLNSHADVFPVHPLKNVLLTAPFAHKFLLKSLRRAKLQESAVPQIIFFDSGGYQVQQGKIDFQTLCSKLLQIYQEEQWADYYVLPDFPPVNSDTDADVEKKIYQTLKAGELFLSKLDFSSFPAVPIGVIHARTTHHASIAIKHWLSLGISYFAFGSFSTSGKNYQVNQLSSHSIKLLQFITDNLDPAKHSLHLFGIGNPSSLSKLAQFNIQPTSFDSTAWQKEVAYGSMFPAYPNHCTFCSNPSSRYHKALHNLLLILQTAVSLQSKTQPDQPTLF